MKIVVCGNYGAKNLGDEMILEGLLTSLRASFNNPEISVISANPEETSKQHQVVGLQQIPTGLRSILKSVLHPPAATLKAIRECDYFVLGGGGLFASLSTRANFIWYLQALPAIWHKKNILALGQSIGQTKNPIIKRLIRAIFKRAKYIAVRDSESKENLKKLGIKNEIQLFPDFAFRNPNHHNEPRQKRAVISLRQTKDLTPQIENTLIQFLDWLINTQKLTLHFINFQAGPDSDAPLHERIIQKLAQPQSIHYEKAQPSTSQAQKLINTSQYLIGMRLHSVISAIKTHTPFLAISYSPKVANLVADLHLNQNLLDLKEITLEKLQTKFQKLATPKPNFNEQFTLFETHLKHNFAHTDSSTPHE